MSKYNRNHLQKEIMATKAVLSETEVGVLVKDIYGKVYKIKRTFSYGKLRSHYANCTCVQFWKILTKRAHELLKANRSILRESFRIVPTCDALFLELKTPCISKSLNVTELKSLPSYDDINYRLKTNEGSFLLKIFHGEMSANKIRLEEQLNCQYFLKNKVIY